MRRRSESSRNRLGRAGVDMTSMVDVAFLLLIFFMVTASFQFQKSLAMPTEESNAGRSVANVQPPDIRLQIDSVGSFFVMTQDREFETPSKQQLIAILSEAASMSKAERLLIEVDQAASLPLLVQALDAGAAAGLTDVRVSQVESASTASLTTKSSKPESARTVFARTVRNR